MKCSAPGLFSGMVRCSIVVAAEIGSDITGVEIEVGSNNIVLSDVVGIAKLIDEV